eukprot:SAG31_NODE_43999_length_264_cov_1.557576_1_plen_76_part_10
MLRFLAGGQLHLGDVEDLNLVIDGLASTEDNRAPLGQESSEANRLACVACPLHTYVFDLATGKCLTNPEIPPASVY